MRDEIQHLVDQYLAWLKDRTILRELEDSVEITIPYLDWHNDYLQIYAKRENGAYLLTDGGETIEDLRLSGWDLNSPGQQELLQTTLSGFGIRLNNDALEVNASPEQFPQQQHNLIQAMLAVNDLFQIEGSTCNKSDMLGLTNNSQLGKLESVSLRNYWQKGSAEFTPWLARPENIKSLGNELGLELEVEAQGKDVGPFRAEILCREIESSNRVIIENQPVPTDHSHLGQLLTYAAGRQATIVIWIAESVRPEHRAALDWLNEITREGVAFYGVEIELLRIGDSPPAPRFNVVSRPNKFAKEVKSGALARER